MQTVKQYVTHATKHSEHALDHMPVSLAEPDKYTRGESIRTIEDLLTLEEQRLCDMATD